MDPLSAFSIATGVITFVNFGGKLVSRYLEIKKSENGRPAALSALEAESRDLSGHAAHARNKIASLQARYPRQAASLTRLAAECVEAEKDLQKLADSLTAKPDAGGHHGLRARGAVALVSIRGALKQGDIDGLERRLRSIREQVIMSVIMCISDDATESRAKLTSVDNGVGDVLGILRPIKLAIDNLQPEFATISRGRPLATVVERGGVAGGLWTSITTGSMDIDLDQADSQASPAPVARAPANDSHIASKILGGLKFENMTSRETQIGDPFPETFQWLLDCNASGASSSSPTPSRAFKDWLESQADQTPFWITGKPASGKSTLMKFISTNPRVQSRLRAWCGKLPLLMSCIYFWNPGSPGQKSQVGLLSTILHQLLSQRRDLSRSVAPRRYLYYQLAGADAPDPPEWTLEELRDSVSRFVSQIKGTSRLAIFVDGLDEYEGDLEQLVSFLKRLHQDHDVKLCVSSRPWNTFKDAFHTYPSLRMELLTKPDIVKYVCTRIGDSLAFNELRQLDSASVEELESRIIEKADGVFLWVVLVVEQLITTARENNDLREIWRVFDTMPPGLEELYASMRRRLDATNRRGSSRMYQLLFQWNEIFNDPFYALEFWVAVNYHDPTEPQPWPEADFAGIIRPALERRLAGATGGMLQIHGEGRRPCVGFLHRTVFDWLRDIKPLIKADGPVDYDPGLVLTSLLVSLLNRVKVGAGESWPLRVGIGDVFSVAQSCKPSPEARYRLLRIVDGVQVGELYNGRNMRLAYLQPEVARTLSSYSDSTVRSYLATRHFCAPYLQAKLESSESRTTGLELPRKLHMLPTRFWDPSQKYLVTLILDGVLSHGDLQNEPLALLNRRLRTFEVLVLQAPQPFTTHRALRAEVKRRIQNGGSPKEFWDALHAGLQGKGIVELTSISFVPRAVQRAEPPPRSVPLGLNSRY